MAQKSTFYLENQNSETTFISSTFKVEETKVVSEFWFCGSKVDFLAFFELSKIIKKINLLYQKEKCAGWKDQENLKPKTDLWSLRQK